MGSSKICPSGIRGRVDADFAARSLDKVPAGDHCRRHENEGMQWLRGYP